MALTKTIAEIKEVLPKLYSTVSNTSTLPNTYRAEYKYIVPVIGTTLYNSLVTAYEANTLTVKQLQLVKHIRLASVAYATLDEIGLFVLTLQDSGAKKVQQGNTEPIRAWEVADLKTTLVNMATDGMELLITYLLDNKTDFAEWTSSDAYTKINMLLIKTGADLNEQYTIYQPQRSFFILKSLLYDVQFLYLYKTIGEELVVYLRDKVSPTTKEKACISLLKKALGYYTIAKACKNYSVSFSDNGFTILGDRNTLNGESTQPADKDLLQMKIKECESEGDSYINLANYELVALYSDTSVTNDYKTAFDKSPLKDYVQPVDRTSGNETRKIFRF